MSRKWPSPPKNMGEVLESFAAAIQDEQKRGLPRFSAEQVQRIEAVVHHLDPEQAGTKSARITAERPSSRTGAKPPSKPSSASQPGSQRPDERRGTAPEVASPSHASTAQPAAPQSAPGQPVKSIPPAPTQPGSASRAKPTHDVQHVASAIKSDPTATPVASAPPEDLPPWMIDESAEAATPAAVRPRQTRQPATKRTASKAEAMRDTQQPRETSAQAPQQDSQRRAPAPASTLSPQDNAARLQAVRQELGDCTRCGLCETRTNIVFGDGNPHARLFLIGEAPSRRDDESGHIFSDEAGELLSDMLKAMTLSKEEVYITTVLKCRPPNNRAATRDELASCAPFLRKQIEAVQPEIILTLGSQASRLLLGARFPFGQNRGEWNEWENIAVMPTWHPGYLLQFPQEKASAWKDLQKVMSRLGLK